MKYGKAAITYVKNFTDIDDKIICESNTAHREISDITNQTIAWYNDDMAWLGNLMPTHTPKATQFIPEIIEMIQVLIDKNNAHIIDGNVVFKSNSFKGYGKLSGRTTNSDFALWKSSTVDDPGWDSPWGYGRPGWHIECSAMSNKLLGPTFDIHGVGLDLKFPHHENEIAQSCCATKSTTMSNFWFHNEMLMVNGQKMSKSANNFITVNDLDMEWFVARFILLGTHYRKILNWTDEKISQATATMSKWYYIDEQFTMDDVPQNVINALYSDLNVPLAISHMHKFLCIKIHSWIELIS